MTSLGLILRGSILDSEQKTYDSCGHTYICIHYKMACITNMMMIRMMMMMMMMTMMMKTDVYPR